MHRTDITCGEDGCSEQLRVREHGPVRAYPRQARTSDALVPVAEVGQCVAIQRNGERCDHSAGDTRVCGQHGGDVATAARRGFTISTAAYVSAVRAEADGTGAHVRMIERERPRGREHECPHHGRVRPPEASA